jgi:hypothetical protein
MKEAANGGGLTSFQGRLSQETLAEMIGTTRLRVLRSRLTQRWNGGPNNPDLTRASDQSVYTDETLAAKLFLLSWQVIRRPLALQQAESLVKMLLAGLHESACAVAEVENRTTLKISRKLIFRLV